MPSLVTFLFPAVLFGLALLPIVWLLLRLLPPTPKRIPFPAIMLLRNLKETEKPSQHTPWWLLLLRVTALGLFILAMAEPVTHTAQELYDSVLKKDRPVLLLIDNDWAAGQNWQQRQDMAQRLIERVHRSGRNIIVVPTASRVYDTNIVAAEAAKGLVRQITPQPWPADYDDIAEKTARLSKELDTFWISNGFHSGVAGEQQSYKDSETYHLINLLRDRGEVTLVDAGNDAYLPTLLKVLPGKDKNTLTLEARRLTETEQAVPATVVMYGEGGRVLGQERMMIAAGSSKETAQVAIDTDRRNQLTHLKIQQASHAGGTYMVDENWRFRPVGIAATEAMLNNQGYLNDIFYMIRALEPYADLRTGTVHDMLEGTKLAVMMISDDYPLTSDERGELRDWVEKGGMLVRFAGPNIAAQPDRDNLLPVRLRYGGRDFEGSLTWDVPQELGSFAETGPFAGLEIPEDSKITVSKQVLAEPSLELEEKIWARLTDKTPLVTGGTEGAGHIVLFHTTANPLWSDISISGVFIEMLKRLIALSVGVTGIEGQDVRLMPDRLLDGFGRLQPAGTQFEPITNQKDFLVNPKNPPGFYGEGDALKAFNLIDHVNLPTTRITYNLPDEVKVMPYESGKETSFKPHLAVTVLLLLLADFLISLYMRGLLTRPVRAAMVIAAVSLLGFLPGTALAQQPAVKESEAIRYTNETWIAYVMTGDGNLDQTSRRGLDALRRMAGRRTSVDIQGVVGVNPERDVLTYFPFIYWPISASQTPLTRRGRDNVQDYLENGGLILFDTRDSQYGMDEDRVDQGRGAQHLKTLLRGMRIPALHPVPEMHALRRSFYLLDNFPGRYNGGRLWVQKKPAQDHDNVPSMMIGGNDWAGAWATMDNGRPMFRIDSGGERQREMAYRFGINVIMMALTGNYKVDQIHTQELLNRIGR
jgi:hypothetical protein